MDEAYPRPGRRINGGVNFQCVRLLLLVSLLYQGTLYTQPVLHSRIRGVVIDKQTSSPLPGATVIIVGSDPLIGTASGQDGSFLLKDISIGNYRIRVTFIGYIPYTSDELTVTSGKETFIEVKMQETVLSTGEVEIKSDYRKYEAINKMATISVRSFSVDETLRFPGSYNDPARMTQNFAGVTSGIDNRNDIIVRGNSPMGLQWRIDEMEIPNPNHFAAVGTTGGPVTVLNSNLLTNSDFLTGAYPAQYGNALAGIFDMRMRNGNNQKHEYWGEIGWNGIEFGTEGPFSTRHTSSYMAAYRYSLIDILGYFRIDIGVRPQYQDLNFKMNFPTRKAGTFTITGIGGISYIELFDSRKNQSHWTFPDRGENLANGSNLGSFGITHQVFIDPSLRIKNLIYVVGSMVYTKIDTFSYSTRIPSPWAGEKSSEVKISWAFHLVKKFSATNTLEAGTTSDFYHMSFADSMMIHQVFRVNTGSKEHMNFFRGYIQWQHRFTDKLNLVTGGYGSWLTLNNSWSLEPRVGLEWQINNRHSIGFGAGLYSQMQPHVIYFILSHFPDGSTWQPNRDLGFTRCWMINTEYNFLLTENLRFKIDLYYQHLYDIPVKSSIPQYSLINQGHEFFLDRQYADSLVNSGSAENYGVEFTMERFFRKHYYFLLTTSLFNSTYQGSDGIVRNSPFDVNYVLNATGGYEFVIGKRKWGVMSFGLRATWAGGNPYIPFVVDATMRTGEPVPDWKHTDESKFPEYKRFSFRFGIRRNLPSYTIEFIVDVQYRTNYTNVYLQRIDPLTGQIRYYFNMGFFPMATWRIQF
jgi:hypothetical protein